ncbi:7-dehydrocholesterol reductase-like [Lytechinus pictus]|uniref:7-dehydrocholesterol reductase-like n=1 Tax=Lytechinus pictus TaxID=7653 RepID=UPI0030B9BEDC
MASRGITMTEPTSYSRPTTRSQSKRLSEETTEPTTNGTSSVDPKAGQWGRAWEVDVFTTVGVLLLLTLIPLIVFYVHVSCTHYQCSLIAPPLEMRKGALTPMMLWDQMPPITWDGVTILAIWMAFQVVLFYLPDLFRYIIPGYVGGIQLGAVTPSGIRNPYNINGLQAWFISNGIFVANALYFGWFSPSIVFDHRGALLWTANAVGVTVATFAIVKAYFFPTHAADRVFTGNIFYDYMMGIEFNPRIGKMFDFKLFFNGRPGIVAWTIINFSMACKQYELYGYVTNSMILVNFLEAIYVVDYFWNEAWYLHTIDMHHDHFGWYLAWGDMVYLPFMYTLQCFYLVFNPVELSWPIFTAIFLLGTIGYYIFRSVNRQKDYFRRTNGQAPIWGAMPKYIDATYTSGDGQERKSKLLLSGWWGVTRHMNYTGDLMQAAAWCLSCGVGHIFPYYYLVFMTILLIHRCRRDEDRCHAKYGKSWELYMKKVPCRLIPYIY